MEKFAFEQFIQDNNIDINTLSPNLKKRILGFQELKEDYQHAIDEDQEDLEATIKNLAMELEEDLYEEFEDRLENNDTAEDEAGLIKLQKDNLHKLVKLIPGLLRQDKEQRLTGLLPAGDNKNIRATLDKKADKRYELELEELHGQDTVVRYTADIALKQKTANATGEYIGKAYAGKYNREKDSFPDDTTAINHTLNQWLDDLTGAGYRLTLSDPVKEEQQRREKEEKERKEKEENTPKQPTDEDILEKLYNMKRRNIGRSALKGMGFKGNISGSTINIGKYRLARTGMLSYTYVITKTRE